MRILKRKWLFIICGCLFTQSVVSQELITIERALEISIENSPDIKRSLMNLQRYQELMVAQLASLKSNFSLSLSPLDYSQSRSFDSRISEWYTNERFSTGGNFSISQPIIWTDATVTLNNRFSWQQNISSSNNSTNKAFNNDLSISINQPLFTYNRKKMELRTMEMDYENAFISYALQRLSMERQITSQFYGLYTSQVDLDIAKGELNDALENYEIIKNKVEADIAAKAELFQAELNLSSAQSSVDNRSVSLSNAKDDFKQLLGLPLNLDIDVVTDIDITRVEVDMERAIENARDIRLELRQREITRQKAEFDLIKVKDDNKFTGSISASYGLTGNHENFGQLYDTPTRSPRISVQFNVPIFDWGTRKARIKAQEIQMNMNEIDATQELLEMEINIRKTCRSLNNLLQQIDIAKKGEENAQLTYDLNAEKYRNGDLTGMEMNQFQSQLSSRKMAYSQALINYKLELLNLKILSLYDFEKNETLVPLKMYKPNIELKTRFGKLESN